jgi:small-conductance mechanosensitive channel
MADALLRFGERFPQLLPFLGGLAVAAFLLTVGYWLLIRRHADVPVDSSVPRQAAMLLLTAFCVVLVLMTAPVSDSTRAQLLSLLGLVLTAVIALSSTTFVSNAMAGLMLHAVKNFRPGDFVRVGNAFGRVTERG